MYFYDCFNLSANQTVIFYKNYFEYFEDYKLNKKYFFFSHRANGGRCIDPNDRQAAVRDHHAVHPDVGARAGAHQHRAGGCLVC